MHCFNTVWIRSALISETRSRFITKRKMTGLKSIELHFKASSALKKITRKVILNFCVCKQDNEMLEIHIELFNLLDLKFGPHAKPALSQSTTGSSKWTAVNVATCV